MHGQSVLETRLVEVMLNAMFPCDLGDGIEVVHDVETIDVELECDVEERVDWTAPFTYDFHAAETVPYPKQPLVMC